jgi:hypothetical protein
MTSLFHYLGQPCCIIVPFTRKGAGTITINHLGGGTVNGGRHLQRWNPRHYNHQFHGKLPHSELATSHHQFKGRKILAINSHLSTGLYNAADPSS